MSGNPNSNSNANSLNNNMDHQRRGSVTSAAFSNLFQRSSSASQNPPCTSPIAAAAINEQRRRLSISTVGLSGTSPSAASASSSFMRRASMSTNNSDSLDESAVDEEESSRTAPVTPFHRRMSLGAQAMRAVRPGVAGSPGSGNDQGFNWSEKLKSRAESNAAAGQRPSFSFAAGLGASPPRAAGGGGAPRNGSPHHDRAKSVSDMPPPPAAAPKPRQPQKPDHIQERILKGDFYMD